MCVIAICEKRRLTDDEVWKMAAANPHGIGVAWANRTFDQAAYVKGLTPDEAVSLLAAAPMPHVVHFRFASVGAVKTELCHPFPIEPVPSAAAAGAASAVVFHNGTWSDWELGHALLTGRTTPMDADEKAKWSDTRVLAAMMSTYRPRLVAKVAGETQRIVVVRGDGRIERFGAFVEHRGLLVSNLWWLATRETSLWTPPWGEESFLDDEEVMIEDDAPRCADETHCRPETQPLDCTQPLTPRTLGKPRVPRPLGPSRYFPRNKNR